MSDMTSTRIHLALLVSGALYLIWSAINPAGRFNWLMEAGPAIVGAIILIATYRHHRMTTVNYVLVWLFSLILMTGAKYTYAEVPIGNWVRDAFSLSRNHFDRMGHFFQGVIPAMLARELLLRTSPIKSGKWLFTICVSMALAVSACYELFEWRYAVTFGGEMAEDFLGSQGDVWDAQQDMFMALSGAIVSLLTLSAVHDRQLARLKTRQRLLEPSSI